MESILGQTLDEYQIISQLGSNATFLGTRLSDNKEVVIKQSLLTNDFTQGNLEVHSFDGIEHDNVLVPIKNIYKRPYFYTVYEYWPGATLAEYVKEKKSLTEVEVREIMEQLICGYLELEKCKVIYKNIKPENIFVLRDNKFVVKLFDFANVEKKVSARDPYLAPEIIAKETNFPIENSSDIWSIGAVMYFVINGYPPIETLEQKKINTYFLHSEVSPCCKDLVLGCLEYEPKNRPMIEEILRHPFITGEEFVRPLLSKYSHETEIKNIEQIKVPLKFAMGKILL